MEDKKNNAIKSNIQENIKTHLQMLIDEFNRYFPEYTKEAKVYQKLIRNPFSTELEKLLKKSRKNSLNYKMAETARMLLNLIHLSRFGVKKQFLMLNFEKWPCAIL